jgi:hypothetical protein
MQAQTDKLYQLLLDGKPHRTDEIQISVYGAAHLGVARIGARIFDLQKKYGVKVSGWKDKIRPSLYWYKMEREEPMDAKKLTDEDVERLFKSTINKLKAFDLTSIEFVNAYRKWQRAKPEDRDRCKGVVVFLYRQVAK